MIIGDSQINGNIKQKENARLYVHKGDGAGYSYVPKDGGLSVNIKFNSLINVTGISIQGKSSVSQIQFTKRYAISVTYGNQDKKSHMLGKVKRKYSFVFFLLPCLLNCIKLI